MGSGVDGPGDLVEMELRGSGVARGQDEPGAFALGGTDGAEDVGRLGALVARRARPGSAPRYATRSMPASITCRTISMPGYTTTTTSGPTSATATTAAGRATQLSSS